MTRLVLFRNHFQMGYVVRDLKKATENLGNKFGVTKWRVVEMLPEVDLRYVGFAYVQNTLLELLEIKPDRDTIFSAWIPEEKSAVRLNHFEYMMESQEEWNVVSRQFEMTGFSVALPGNQADVQFAYYDTVAELGHYCELIYPGPTAKEFFEAPHN
jgi:extradiol dioxygenase family protein